MDTDPYLHHITLGTGHTRRSRRSEVDLHVTAALLQSALGTSAAPIPGAPGYILYATTEGDALLATVAHEVDGPIALLGVARTEGVSPRLWAFMLRTAVESIPGTRDLDRPLPAPWLAVRLYPTIAFHPDAAVWLGDFERCIAWAWIES